MADRYKIPYVDYSGEASVATFSMDPAVTDLNITALFNAVEGITLGASGQSVFTSVANKDLGPGGLPVSPSAQRETKYLVRFHDDVDGEKYRMEIPTADTAALGANSDFVDLTAGTGLAFKTAFETAAVARRTDNTVTLDSVELVGRNL